MAQYCELAGKVTNCTDNCKNCLEEEEKVRDIKVGDKVRYIIDAATAKEFPEFYPPKGTIGVVIGIKDFYYTASYHIRWPKGTTEGDGCWYVERKDIELV